MHLLQADPDSSCSKNQTPDGLGKHFLKPDDGEDCRVCNQLKQFSKLVDGEITGGVKGCYC